MGRHPAGNAPVSRARSHHVVVAPAPRELTTYGCFVEEAQLGISRKLRKELEIGAELDEAREVHVTCDDCLLILGNRICRASFRFILAQSTGFRALLPALGLLLLARGRGRLEARAPPRRPRRRALAP